MVLVGSADEIPLSVPDVAMRELNVTGIFRYTGTWPIARELEIPDQSAIVDAVFKRAGTTFEEALNDYLDRTASLLAPHRSGLKHKFLGVD